MYRLRPKQFQEGKKAQEQAQGQAQEPRGDNRTDAMFSTLSPMFSNNRKGTNTSPSHKDSNIGVQVPSTQEFNITTSQELALLDYQSQDEESS